MKIFEYTDLNTYLKDVFNSYKKQDPKYSLRYWTQKIQASSAGALNQMINGQRPIPSKLIANFINALNLNNQESLYFKELYLLSKDDQSNSRKKHLAKLNPLNWRKKKVVQDSKYLNPLFFAIRVFNKRNLIDENAENIKKYFVHDINEKDLDRSINAYEEYLKSNLSKNPNDRLVTTTDIDSINVQDIHKFYLNLAEKRVANVPVDKREYNTYSINIDSKNIPEIKDKIRYFLDSIIQEYGDDINGNTTYQLGNYLYPLTKEEEL